MIANPSPTTRTGDGQRRRADGEAERRRRPRPGRRRRRRRRGRPRRRRGRRGTRPSWPAATPARAWASSWVSVPGVSWPAASRTSAADPVGRGPTTSARRSTPPRRAPPGPPHVRHHSPAVDRRRQRHERVERRLGVEIGAAEGVLLGGVRRRPADVVAHPRPSCGRAAEPRPPDVGRRRLAMPALPPAGHRRRRCRGRYDPSERRLGELADLGGATGQVGQRGAAALPGLWASTSRRASPRISRTRAAYPNRKARRQRCVAAGVARRTAAIRAAACRCNDS